MDTVAKIKPDLARVCSPVSQRLSTSQREINGDLEEFGYSARKSEERLLRENVGNCVVGETPKLERGQRSVTTSPLFASQSHHVKCCKVRASLQPVSQQVDKFVT
ncbi:hypothetical protein J6590_005055 [Homalodisca vitripennis]|nr:hypothetical protein J6590_005055 [Homalodisca vitripennis]